jgi:hypothetical protein
MKGGELGDSIGLVKDGKGNVVEDENGNPQFDGLTPNPDKIHREKQEERQNQLKGYYHNGGKRTRRTRRKSKKARKTRRKKGRRSSRK